MSNIIELPKGPLTGKMTFIAPLVDCPHDFGERLYHAVSALFHCWDMKITERNFVNETGDDLVMYNIDVTDWSGPENNWLDKIVEDSRGQETI